MNFISEEADLQKRKPRSMKVLSPKQGFHKAKNEIQKKYMESQATQVLENLDAFLQATWDSAPVRDQLHPYCLDRTIDRIPNRREGSIDTWGESQWEAAAFAFFKCNPINELPFEGIISYQTLLRNDGKKGSSWGEIDLMAQKNRLPVVIELKSASKGEYLLRAILEVVANAIAIRKAWQAEPSRLREDWAKVLPQFEYLAPALDKIPCVIMAPEAYWTARLDKSKKNSPAKTPEEARPVLSSLLKALANKGYPISFVELIHDISMVGTLPTIMESRIASLAVQELVYTSEAK